MLKICNVMPQDSGIYTCVATNEHGTASTSATIKVQGSYLAFADSVYLIFRIKH